MSKPKGKAHPALPTLVLYTYSFFAPPPSPASKLKLYPPPSPCVTLNISVLSPMVLAFALGRPEEVELQDGRRVPDGFFHNLPRDKFAQSSTTPFGDVVLSLIERQSEVKPLS
jgi:hypothetical protein